jgi:hypothetical protein
MTGTYWEFWSPKRKVICKRGVSLVIVFVALISLRTGYFMNSRKKKSRGAIQESKMPESRLVSGLVAVRTQVADLAEHRMQTRIALFQQFRQVLSAPTGPQSQPKLLQPCPSLFAQSEC